MGDHSNHGQENNPGQLALQGDIADDRYDLMCIVQGITTTTGSNFSIPLRAAHLPLQQALVPANLPFPRLPQVQ